jgi:uncharacterized membrane protein
MTEPTKDLAAAARRWFDKAPADLLDGERRALKTALKGRPLSENVNTAFDQTSSFGDRLADRVASFGGSWTFIILFGVVLLAWTLGNDALRGRAFDPYPFIFLNLMLSMLAAIQAPIIMMSQNRQSARDRLDATHDYEVNLKAELEIMALHDKLDQMRTGQLEQLVLQQQEQLDLLTRLVAERTKP